MSISAIWEEVGVWGTLSLVEEVVGVFTPRLGGTGLALDDLDPPGHTLVCLGL